MNSVSLPTVAGVKKAYARRQYTKNDFGNSVF